MIGISTYFHDIDFDYLKSVSSLGITHIFTSLQVIEEDYTDFKDKLKSLIEFTKLNNMILIPDVSPKSCEKLGINNIIELKNMGFKVIRIDGGFESVDEITKLHNYFDIYLNASDVNPEFLHSLFTNNCTMNKFSVMHNFYPRYFTGLNKDHMLKLNKEFKSFGVRVAAFVQGDLKLRGPVFEGLPTLEKHRGVNPYIATVELLNSYVDDVYIGDNSACLETLKFMVEYDENKLINLKSTIYNNYDYLENLQTPIRRDITDNIIRLSFGRGDIKSLNPQNSLTRFNGAITIDNNLSGRYVGEVNICKTNLPSDSKINIAGHIHPHFLPLLEYVQRDSIIKFIK